MKKESKANVSTILIIISTIILAGVAIFTAVKLYTTREESISLTSPESQPEAKMLDPMQFMCRKGNEYNFRFRVGPLHETQCGISGFHDASQGCPQCNVRNQVSNYSSTFSINIDPNSIPQNFKGEIKVNYIKASNWCPEPCGQIGSDNLCGVCHQNQKENTGQLILNSANRYSGTVTVERGSDNGLACGSYQTDLTITSIEGVDRCDMTFPKPVIAGLCHTGIDCDDDEYSNLACQMISFSLYQEPTETTTPPEESPTESVNPSATVTETLTASPTSTQNPTSSVTQTSTPAEDDGDDGGVGGESDSTTIAATKAPTKSGETLPDAGFSFPTLFSGILSLLLISLALILAI